MSRFLLLLAWSLVGSAIARVRAPKEFVWLYVGALCGPFALAICGPKNRPGRHSTGYREVWLHLTLTELDVRRLLSGQALWYRDLEEAWLRLLASAIRYETPSGLKRLTLQRLEKEDYFSLHRMCCCAEQATRTEAQEDRIHAWAERFEKKLLKRVDLYEAR
jgi:hypothetical protein